MSWDDDELDAGQLAAKMHAETNTKRMAHLLRRSGMATKAVVQSVKDNATTESARNMRAHMLEYWRKRSIPITLAPVPERKPDAGN